MLYHLLPRLHEQIAGIEVVQYITVRTAASSLTAFVISLVLGPWMIRRLRAFQIGQVIRQDGPASHVTKAGTPTMGGLLILAAVFIPTLLWARLDVPYTLLCVLALIWMGALGFLDDYLKVTRHSHRGLFARYKLLAQLVVALGVGLTLISLTTENPPLYNTRLIFPFFKNWIPDLGWFYVPFAMLVLVGSTNAVNLTDGLDGLAISIFAVSAGAFTALAYVTGHRVFAEYLLLVRFAPAAELTVFCGALVGASLGFLWYNAHPAEVFMGDTGSLAMGGAIAVMAILLKSEFLLLIVGGVFELEAFSVIVQVSWFRYTLKKTGTGRRVFLMSPIHHHFEQLGWPETKVVIRFWILGLMFAMLAISTLKIR